MPETKEMTISSRGVARAHDAQYRVTLMKQVMLVIAAVLLLNFGLPLIVYIQTGIWQMLVVVANAVLSALLLAASYVLVRRGRLDAAGYLLLLLPVVNFSIGELVWAGATLYFVVGGVLAVLIGGNVILPRKGYVWVLIAAVFGAVIWLINWSEPVVRYDITEQPLLVYAVPLMMAVVLIVMILQTFRAVRISTIRTRLLFAFVAIALLPGLVIAGGAIVFGMQGARDRSLEQLRSVVAFRKTQIDNWVAELALNLGVEVSRESNLPVRVLQAAPGSPEFEEAYRLQQDRFQETIALQRDFVLLFLMDPQGRVVLATDSGFEGEDYSSAVFFQRGLSDVHVQRPEYSSALREIAVTVAQPVLDARGNVIGVIAGQTSMDILQDIMADLAGLSETGETYLLDPDGRLLTPLRSGEPRTRVFSEGSKLAVEEHRSGSGLYENYAQIPVLGVYEWLPELEVGLLAELGQAEALESVGTMIKINGAVMVASILLAILGASFVTRNIADPIAELATTAGQIAEGDYTRVVEVTRADEIGTLAQAFNRMTAQLREVIGSLEARVAERTTDVGRRSAQLQAAASVSRQAAAIRDVDKLLAVTVQQISEQFGFYHAGIFMLDDNKEYAVLKATSSEGGRKMLARAHKLKVGEVGIVGYAAAIGDSRIALDVGDDAHYFGNPDLPLTRSEVALPLKVHDEVIGVLDVQSTEPGAFSSADITYLQTMADQVALAIENARLLGAAEQQLEQIRRLLQTQSREGWAHLSAERPSWGYVYDGMAITPQEKAQPVDVSPQLILPLAGARESIGSVKITWADRQPTPEDVELAQAVITQASQALESARLFSGTQEALEEVGVLYRASRAIGEAQTVHDVLQVFVDYLVGPRIDRCVLAIIEPGSPAIAPTVCIEAAWEPGVERSPVLGNRWNVAQIPIIAKQISETLAISDVATSPQLDEVSRHVLQNVLGIKSALFVPLTVTGQLLGWLLVEALEQGYTFTVREVRLYRSLVDQAAITLQSFRLLEEANRRARREQLLGDMAARTRAAATDVDSVLQTAIRELGLALQATGTITVGGTEVRQASAQRNDEGPDE